MDDDRHSPQEAPILDEEPAEHVPGSFLSALPQFFVFPAILVATLTVTYLVLRVLAGGEPQSAAALLAEVRAAGPHARWQILHSLADGLRKQTLDLDDVPTEALASLYEASLASVDGPTGRANMLLTLLPILAYKRDPVLTPHALAALEDPDEEVRLAALSALGVMRDPVAVPALIERLDASSSEVRDMALAALANLARAEDGAAARDVLADQLLASDTTLARNAVLELARLGDERATPFLTRMLQPDSYAGDSSLAQRVAGLPDEASRIAALDAVVQQFLVFACKAAGRLGDPAVVPHLQKLRDDPPSLKVKSAAIDALHAMRASES